MNERQAIARLKQGEIQALAVLVERYQVKALRAAYLITQDRELAQDVVQSKFVDVYHRIHQFDENRPFEPWFMRSVVNAAIKAARKSAQHISIDELEAILPHPFPSPADEAEAQALHERVAEALQKLSPAQRAVIVLKYYLDMSEDDMAEELERPVGTIKWRLHAARRQLRGLLKEE